MLTRGRPHHTLFGVHWDPANVTLTVMLTLLFLIFLMLLLTITAEPAQGQSILPATAREAANMLAN